MPFVVCSLAFVGSFCFSCVVNCLLLADVMYVVWSVQFVARCVLCVVWCACVWYASSAVCCLLFVACCL